MTVMIIVMMKQRPKIAKDHYVMRTKSHRQPWVGHKVIITPLSKDWSGRSKKSWIEGTRWRNVSTHRFSRDFLPLSRDPWGVFLPSFREASDCLPFVSLSTQWLFENPMTRL